MARVRNAAAVIPEARIAVQAAERSHGIELARFEAGTGLDLEVFAAQDLLARTQLELAESSVRCALGRLELAAAIGGWDSDHLSETARRRSNGVGEPVAAGGRKDGEP